MLITYASYQFALLISPAKYFSTSTWQDYDYAFAVVTLADHASTLL